MASTDARPIPRKNTAFRVTFPIFDADGDLVTGASSLDSEVSIDGASFSDCTNEATEIGSTGFYYLDLTAAEMNGDTIAVQVKTATSGAKTTPLVFYPEEAGDIRCDTVQISGDSTAADNLEAAADGNGYNLGGGSVVAASVTGNVGGNVAGDVGGKVLGGGSGTITGTGVRSDLRAWNGTAPGNLDGNGFVPSNMTAMNGNTTRVATLSTAMDNDRLDVALSSRLATAGYTAPLDAAGTRAAVGLASANLDTQLADLPTVAEFEARTLAAAAYFDPATDQVTPTTASKSGYSLSATGLDSITATDPGGVASTFPQMVVQLWRRFFKKTTLTTTQLKTYADDGTTVRTTQTVSDDNTTQTQGSAS